jgi:hypothetical protein
VQLAVYARAFVIAVLVMALLRDTFLLQGRTSRIKTDFVRRNNLLEVRGMRRTASVSCVPPWRCDIHAASLTLLC